MRYVEPEDAMHVQRGRHERRIYRASENKNGTRGQETPIKQGHQGTRRVRGRTGCAGSKAREGGGRARGYEILPLAAPSGGAKTGEARMQAQGQAQGPTQVSCLPASAAA